MARRTIDYAVTAEGRDKGKVFRITEASAAQAERWAFRAMVLMAQAGADIPDDVQTAGVAGLMSCAIEALPGLNVADAIPLLDEMLTCIALVFDPSKPHMTRPLIDDDIEEVSTRVKLRGEIIRLHLGFSQPGAPSQGWPGAAQPG